MGCAGASPPRSHADPGVHARQLFALGVTQQRAGQSRQAIITLTDAINSGALTGANAARAVFDRGLANDTLGNTKAAIADYTDALRRDPSLSAAYNNRGNAYRRSGQFENAKRDYLAALNSMGAAPQYSYYGLGLIAVHGGDLDHARSYFQKALVADPRFSSAAQSLAALNSKPAVKSVARATPTPATTQPRVADAQLRPTINDASNTNAQVQLGAYRDEASAKTGWAKALADANGALDGLKPVIVTADLPGKGRFWRLRVAVAGRLAARALCARLIDKGQGCILSRD